MQPAFAPTVVLLGAQGTGAPALATALGRRLAAAGMQRVQVLACEDTGACEGDLVAAVQAASAADLTLLMGLDLPCPADRRCAQEAADARLRAALAAAGRGYRVVYGSAQDTRLAHALQALYTIKTIAASAHGMGVTSLFGRKFTGKEDRVGRLRAWNCEKCSDPECEHRLFTALVGSRGEPGPAGGR